MMENLQELYMPLVVLAGLIVGYCIKNIKWLDELSNQYIPTILAVLGAVLGCMINQSATPENIIYGALSGLASTGLHQWFTQTILKEGSSH